MTGLGASAHAQLLTARHTAGAKRPQKYFMTNDANSGFNIVFPVTLALAVWRRGIIVRRMNKVALR